MYEDICNQISILEEQYIELVNEYINQNDANNLLKADSFLKRMNCFLGKNEKAPRDSSQLIVGIEYWVADNDLRYIGIYRSPVQDFIGKENMNLIRTQMPLSMICKKAYNYFVIFIILFDVVI